MMVSTEWLEQQIVKFENKVGDLEEMVRKTPTLEEFKQLQKRIEELETAMIENNR